MATSKSVGKGFSSSELRALRAELKELREQVAESRESVKPSRAIGKNASKRAKKQSGFVAWLRDTAEERAERSHDNRAMSKRIKARKASASEVAKFLATKKGSTTHASWTALAEANGY